MNTLERLQTILDERMSDDENSGCQAVIDESTTELCGTTVWGRGTIDGYEIGYCDSHAPSGAVGMACSGRTHPVVFYVPEADTTIEVS